MAVVEWVWVYIAEMEIWLGYCWIVLDTFVGVGSTSGQIRYF